MAYISFQPSDYFNTLLYTGTGSSNAVTGVGFRPDWVWIKGRDFSDNHNLYDTVRGAEKRIMSNSDGAEEDRPAGLTAFGSDGFTVNTANGENKSSAPIVAWNWKAYGGSGSSNSDGSITSTVSANTTAGFSIVKYGNSTGTQTVGHGLGSDVKLLIIKNLTSATNWHVWHGGIPTSAIHFNETNAKSDSWFANYQNSTAPTSSVFTVKSGSGDDALGSSKDYIAYCFAEKKGFSKFGKYTGNNNNDGAFVYTGFKPNWLLIKQTGGSNQWQMRDGQRGFNGAIKTLYTESSEPETSGDTIDLLSNGFKLRNNSPVQNTAEEFIYMAFAEEPIVSSNGVPATAR